MTKGKLDIGKVAKLAMLRLNPEEMERISSQMEEVLDFMKALDTPDIKRMEPMYNVHEINTPFREDRVGESLEQSKALMNAPATEGCYFKTPKVMD